MSGRYHTEVGKGALKSCITIPEVMKRGGYHTMMVGKWHLNGSPMDRGFDRYFGFLNGASNFFSGESTGGGTHFRLDRKKWQVPKEGFYCTDDFTDFAMRFLDDREKNTNRKDKPFFLYFNSGKTALLQGEWKLADSKELYNITEDRIESNDLSKKQPERFEKMKSRWSELAKEYGVAKSGGKKPRKNKKKKETK